MALRVHLLSLKKLFHMLMSRIPLCPSLPRSCCGHPPGPCCCCHSHPTTFHCTSSRPPTKTALLAGAAAHHMYQLLYNNIQPAYSSPDSSRTTIYPTYPFTSILLLSSSILVLSSNHKIVTCSVPNIQSLILIFNLNLSRLFTI
jgi:hypothetical protein